ncbi:MAG TPA: C4-type zinc ribbon domain-containing protein [Vicinamibacterales bacterium]|nr:C4-type zinc ribbon domain-containing protein [Vicinamibacterales bacterium]
MHSDLQSLIRLQELDLAAERMRRRIADIPAVQAALDERIAALTAAVAAIKEKMSASQAARRDIEKDLAAVQGRLSKYKDQLMEVKTNKEYHAMQTEISTAEQLVRQQEDRLLERMEEAETHAAELKAAEAALRTGQADVAREKQQMEADRTATESELTRTVEERAREAAGVSSAALNLFEHVSKHRKGLAMSEARDGHCMQCHVRLRPQVFNTVRRNETLVQCESCSRILYFIPAPAADAAAPVP